MTMDPLKLLGWTEIILRLGSAVFIGALLGVNRELRGKPAGLRTNALVALGAALTTLASIGISLGAEAGQAADANAVSRAALGILCGAGVWSGALVGTGFTLLVLVIGRPFEKFLHRKFPKLTEENHDEHPNS
jgi:putative Mg2+ transporter-C (MgtC) family protein